ncbi:TonB-dependent receptor [Pseudopedobacter sp.]|uniref:SusC/RagA family TonB-linked outer membrane protein n=1 Tax=Pseudopedobacter sp. TaxID=1936787 RepID=UPI00333FE24C
MAKLKVVFIFCCFILCKGFIANAQKVVTGLVTDKNKEPLIGVGILVKNTTQRVVTDVSGKFSVRSSSTDDVLIVSYIGFKTVEIKIGTNTTLSIVLDQDVKSLDEIVVVGYGEVKQRDLTGSVSSVNLEDLTKVPVGRFDDALAGRIAGVSVTSQEGMPGTEQHVVIRGTNSVTQSNTPLYVIDGFPTEEAINNSISPSDIESITVLKDASATAIYGARAANGVVVVTTKKGKLGKPAINYNGSFGLSHIARKKELMNTYEFVKLQQETMTPADFSSRYLVNDKTSREDYVDYPTIDWQDLIFKQAATQNHNLSIGGGNQNTRYYVSFGAFDQDGIIKNTNYKRYQGRVYLDQKVNDKLRFNVNANYSNFTITGESPSQVQYSNSANLIRNVWSYRPLSTREYFDITQEMIDETIATSSDMRINPLFIVNEEYRKRYNYQARVNGNLDYLITKGLKLRISGGLTKNDMRNNFFNNSRTRSGNPFRDLGVNARVLDNGSTTWLNENTLTYNSTFDKKRYHSYDVLIGQTMQSSKTESMDQTIIQIPDETLGMAGIGLGEVQRLINNLTEWRLNSYIARFNYKYRSKYYFTATFRADGSSKFPEHNRWGYFQSVAGAWNVSQEDFVKNLTFLSNLKLRASWGLTGNNRIPDFTYWTNVRTVKFDEGQIPQTTYPFGGVNSYGSIVTSPGNPNLKWETTAQTDVGIDMSLFNQKVNLTVDMYRKNTSDLLLNANIPTSTGFQSALLNIGEIRNEGLEITIDNTNLTTPNFKWSTSFNISFNRNKVMALSGDQESLISIISYSNAYIARVGQPLGMLYGLEYMGTYKYDDFDALADGTYRLKGHIQDNGAARAAIQPGDSKYRDINGDGIINSLDATVLGRGYPIHFGGLTNRFEYKNFDLNVFFTWNYGNEILFADRLTFMRTRQEINVNKFADFANRWTPDNPTSDIPRAKDSGLANYSSYDVEDGSFLRLANVQLGYELPSSVLRRLKVKKVNVFVSGQNLWLLTNYSGYDPEVSTKHTALTPAYDSSAYPKSKVFNFGINVNF